ncbi:putative lipoprotein [Nitratireductor aquibiodomus]|uniref:Putative lipoprotein n=1 Tax=Nitratireductor aquibiodomus TaxID=204799 RepID=A0A1H4L548_9HYPH|nr:META domain-containing protein [Nitratireductor aquibiodomus]SEB65596.1 putative lipoprotein [Nitratireductor aquibiodomus]
MGLGVKLRGAMGQQAEFAPALRIDRRTALLALTLTGLFLPANLARASGRGGEIHGTVVYRERMALPPEALVEVQLLDVSRADAPADIIAMQKITGAVGSPIEYRLGFDPREVKEGHRYALRATISAGDRLLFTTTQNHAVFGEGPNQTELLVQRVAQSVSLFGEWLVEDIDGGGVMDRLRSTLTLSEDGAVSGSGGCNRFRGNVKVEGASIRFTLLASTNMACSPAAMNQEQAFLKALERARRFEIHQTFRKLVLLDEEGKAILRLAEMSP